MSGALLPPRAPVSTTPVIRLEGSEGDEERCALLDMPLSKLKETYKKLAKIWGIKVTLTYLLQAVAARALASLSPPDRSRHLLVANLVERIDIEPFPDFSAK